MNKIKFQEFSKAYRAGLAKAVEMFPEKFILPKTELAVSAHAERILKEIEKNPYGVIYDSIGFKMTCSMLGIKHTRKAILEYIEYKK